MSSAKTVTKRVPLVPEDQPYPGPMEELLPHRKPFIFVNKLLKVGKSSFVGEATYPASMDFFKGHFPNRPVVPGVILIETMAQCGGAGLIANGTVPIDGLFFLVNVNNAKFRRQVCPDETIRIEVENTQEGSRMVKQHGKAIVNGEVCVEADFACILGTRK
jgi:3-hydroxyacyl-[acyl-carrier-protein] dehydratase